MSDSGDDWSSLEAEILALNRNSASMSDSGDDWSSLGPEASIHPQVDNLSALTSLLDLLTQLLPALENLTRLLPALKQLTQLLPALEQLTQLVPPLKKLKWLLERQGVGRPRALPGCPVEVSPSSIYPPQTTPARARTSIRSHASITPPCIAPRPCPVCNSLRSPPHITSVVGGTTHVLPSKSGYAQHYHLPAEDCRGPFHMITRGRAVGVFENPCIAAALTSGVPSGCRTKHKTREGAIQTWSTALSAGLVEIVN